MSHYINSTRIFYLLLRSAYSLSSLWFSHAVSPRVLFLFFLFFLFSFSTGDSLCFRDFASADRHRNYCCCCCCCCCCYYCCRCYRCCSRACTFGASFERVILSRVLFDIYSGFTQRIAKAQRDRLFMEEMIVPRCCTRFGERVVSVRLVQLNRGAPFATFPGADDSPRLAR